MPPLGLSQEDAHTHVARLLAMSHIKALPSNLALISSRVEFWQPLTTGGPHRNVPTC